MSLKMDIAEAAARLEFLLNLLPNQMTVDCSRVEVTQVNDSQKMYRHQLTITSTHPVQIYP